MPDPTFYIETPRLFISYLIADNVKHCELLIELYNSPHFVEMEGPSSLNTPVKAANFIRNRYDGLIARLGYGVYLASRKTASNKLEDAIPIGTIAIQKGDDTKEGEVVYTLPDIGFAILEKETGKGYATEGAKAIIKYGLENFKLDGVFGFTSEKNVASQKVLEKAGLEYRGVRNLLAFGGEQSRVYALPGMNLDLKEYNIADDV